MKLGYASVKRRVAERFELHSGQQKLSSMEGLRGLSALLVFFVHFYALFGFRIAHSSLHGLFYFLAAAGHTGVDVFFALSGFIMYGLLLKKPFGYFAFIRRRIQRLYPPFIAIFLLYVCISIAVPAYSKLPNSHFAAAAYLIANFFMLPGIFPIVPMITPAWSLSYELCFYLTLPLAMRALRIYTWPRTHRMIFWVCVCVAHLGLIGLVPHPRMIMFECGILMRETMEVRFGREWLGNAVALLSVVLAIAVVGFTSTPLATQYLNPAGKGSVVAPGLLFVSTLALGHYTFRGNGLLEKLFSWDWLRWFGNMSYSYYLTHGLVLHVLNLALYLVHMPDNLSPLAFMTLCISAIAVTIVGSSVVFLAIEKRFSFSRPAVRAVQPVAVASVPVGS